MGVNKEGRKRRDGAIFFFFLYLTLPNPLEGREGLGSLILFIEKVRTPNPALCIVMGAGDTTMEEASCLCGFAVGVQ